MILHLYCTSVCFYSPWAYTLWTVAHPLLAASHYTVCFSLQRNGVKLCQLISDPAAQLEV